ncbi:glycine cleavage system aminomethyltransferase GcvT [Fundicoccus sp. Sow4_H7]|uniref:glycine cleavage system aminomethyltransferase GcvT n=1 Tax=Fundicoccus sp. Sow4_H7 TaxID=3438784 RepID=UPI003F917DA9
MTETLKQTPLYDYYKGQGIKLVDFNGWALPIQFSKIQDEHLAVREKAGLFETSHMGEILVSGNDALDWLNRLVSNDLEKLNVNQAQYNLILNDEGFVLDDLIIYKLSDSSFMLTPNASNTDKILNWLEQHQVDSDVRIEDISNQIALIALQGKNAEAILQSLLSFELSTLKSFYFVTDQEINSIPTTIISRTGYTGEDGFEIYLAWDKAEALFTLLLEKGAAYGLIPCGLGARDTLRLEAGLVLYGNELSEAHNPLEAGLGFAIKLKKAVVFIGRDALVKAKDVGLQKQLIGFQLTGRGIAREGTPIEDLEGNPIGIVTSGTMVPTQDHAIGMAYIDKAKADLDTLNLIIRNKKVEAKITNKNQINK